MEKRKKVLKPINDKNFMLVLGLALVLSMFILIVDTGYTARTLNFVLYFPFGFASYILIGLVLIKGLTYIFISRHTKIPHKGWIIPGFIVLFLGVIGLISIFTADYSHIYLNNMTSKYWELFAHYYDADAIKLPYLYRPELSEIGGGYLGYFFLALFNSAHMGKNSVILIFSFIVLAGLILVIMPFILDRKKNKKTVTKVKKEKKPEPVKQIPVRSEEKEDFYVVKDKSKQIIRNASKLDIMEDKNRHISLKQSTVEPEIPVSQKAVSEERVKIEDTTPHLVFNDNSYDRLGGLRPARFVMHGDEEEFHTERNVGEVPAKSIEESEFNIDKEITVPHRTEERHEQMSLEFDEVEEPARDLEKEKLLTAAPEFSDPIIKEREVAAFNKPEESSVEMQVKEEPKPVVEEKPKKITHKFIEPSLDLLNDYETDAANEKNTQTADQRMQMINEIFQTFNVHAQCIGYVVGPSVTRYNIGYTQTAQFKMVNNLTSDISIRLGGVEARFESIVPGERYSGLEIPNAVVTMVGFKEVLQKLPPRDKHPMAVAFGKNISGDVVYADVNKMPHMLISGTTGSGKSIFIHSIIMTLIMRNNPDDLRLVLVDPKRVEMAKYKGEPHLLCPVITEPEEAAVCMNKLVDEMERRYGLLEQYCVSDIGQYNELCDEKPELERMPYYVAILDEYADLVDRDKDIQRPVVLLSAKARSCGIHLIICTQRPSTNVITGLIKGNLPTHVALMTASSVDSITIIGEGGAEKLLGKGDMLVQSAVVSKVGCVRLQGCFVQNKEIIKVCDFLKSTMTTDYDPNFLDLTDHTNDGPAVMPFEHTGDSHAVKRDEAYDDVKDAIMQEEYASISKIQREFGFGFTRAGRIFNQLVNDGIVEKPNSKRGSSTGCKVLIHDDSYGREADIGSDELSSVESMSEYIANSDKADGGY